MKRHGLFTGSSYVGVVYRGEWRLTWGNWGLVSGWEGQDEELDSEEMEIGSSM